MQVSSTPDGNCCVIVDEQNYLYMALTHSQYAQRFSRALMEEMRAEFYKNNGEAERGGMDPKKLRTRFLSDLAAKYNTPSKFDKVAEAQNKVGEITIKIQDELKKVAGSQQQFSVSNRGDETCWRRTWR